MYDPYDYTITIKRENIEGETFFVSHIAELPDNKDYADTPEEAYQLSIQTINSIQKFLAEDGLEIPAPICYAENSASNGKITLRVPKSLHNSLSYISEAEGMSMNTYILYALTEHTSQKNSYHIIKKALNEQAQSFSKEIRLLTVQTSVSKSKTSFMFNAEQKKYLPSWGADSFVSGALQ